MGLNFEILSITSAFNSIVNFFKSQENNTRWKDLTTGSEGSFLIKFFSNIFSAISYRVIGQSRENYLSSAILPTSNTAIAVNLQYSVYRGSNFKRLVQILPNSSYTYPKLSVIGKYSDIYDIITLDHVSLEEGKVTDIRTVVGKVKEIVFTPGTSAIKPFSLFATGISEDYVLYKTNNISTNNETSEVIELDTTKYVKEMMDNKYLVRTNPYLSVDIMYLNNYPFEIYKEGYDYKTDTEFTLRYVELADIQQIPYISSMFDCGDVQDYSNISTYIPFESVDNIKVTAPLHHDTQNLVRSKADYAKEIRDIVPTITKVNWEPLTPTYTLFTYLKNDLTLLTKTEEEDMNSILKRENFFGTPLPDKTDPRRAVAYLDIYLSLKDKYKNISDIKIDINNLLSNFYEYDLEPSFNTYSLERQLESLTYVKYARVSHKVKERVPNTNYQIGYIIKKDDIYYRVVQILGESADSTHEPSWNVPISGENVKGIDTGLLTEDGGLVWKCYKRIPNIDNLEERQSSFNYGINEFMYTEACPGYMFRCTNLMKRSGQTEPNISLLEKGNFVTDGGLVWVVKDYMDAPIWGSYLSYSLGDTVNVSNSTLFSLECVSYTGTVSTIEDLNFEQREYQIVDLSSSQNSYFKIEGKKTFYFRKGDIISATYSEGYTNFTVTNVNYDSSTNITTINVMQSIDVFKNYQTLISKERGTRDGQILWKIVDDINNIKYEWNTYLTFDYDLNIVGD